jgi:hypothetical protein
MATLWSFDLLAVARANLYLDALEGTESIVSRNASITDATSTLPRRAARLIPH